MENCPNMPTSPNAYPASPRRKALLAGASALALLGLTFGDAAFAPQAGQALAQSSQAQTSQAETAQGGTSLTDTVQAPIAVNPNMAPMSFADVVEKVSPAVVSVQTRVARGERQMSGMDDQMPEEFRRFFRRFGEEFGRGDEEPRPRRRGPRFSFGQGSGFIISADGYVVTNNHVIDEGDQVEVTLQDGREFDAEVVGKDSRTDLAVLKIEGEDLPFVEFAGAEARVGDWVVAVGNPFGLGGTVTAGIISARGRDIGSGPYDDYIQIDAPINRGNSGGPAFNLEGQVVGVNTAIFSPSGGNVGIGFAIPAGAATRIVDELRDEGSITRGWIGVSIQSVSDDIAASLGLDEAYGALVNEPQDGSPASDVGIESGDVIVSVDGARIDNARDLSRLIGSLKPDTTVQLGILRDGDEIELAPHAWRAAGAAADGLGVPRRDARGRGERGRRARARADPRLGGRRQRRGGARHHRPLARLQRGREGHPARRRRAGGRRRGGLLGRGRQSGHRDRAGQRPQRRPHARALGRGHALRRRHARHGVLGAVPAEVHQHRSVRNCENIKSRSTSGESTFTGRALGRGPSPSGRRGRSSPSSGQAHAPALFLSPILPYIGPA